MDQELVQCIQPACFEVWRFGGPYLLSTDMSLIVF